MTLSRSSQVKWANLKVLPSDADGRKWYKSKNGINNGERGKHGRKEPPFLDPRIFYRRCSSDAAGFLPVFAVPSSSTSPPPSLSLALSPSLSPMVLKERISPTMSESPPSPSPPMSEGKEVEGQNVKKRRRRRRPAPSSSSSASPPLPSVSSSPVSHSLLYGSTKEVWGQRSGNGNQHLRLRIKHLLPIHHRRLHPITVITSSLPLFLEEISVRKKWCLGNFLSLKNSSSLLQWLPYPRLPATVPFPFSNGITIVNLP